jgi:hypothetical protein
LSHQLPLLLKTLHLLPLQRAQRMTRVSVVARRELGLDTPEVSVAATPAAVIDAPAPAAVAPTLQAASLNSTVGEFVRAQLAEVGQALLAEGRVVEAFLQALHARTTVLNAPVPVVLAPEADAVVDAGSCCRI